MTITPSLQTEVVISSTSDCTEKHQRNLPPGRPGSQLYVWAFAAATATFVLLQKVGTDPQATEKKYCRFNTEW